MTYESLLDEHYRIIYSYIEFHLSLLDSSVPADKPGKPVYRRLRDDEYFNDIRDMNIKVLGQKLKADLMIAREEAKKVRENQEMDKLDIIRKLKDLDKEIKTIELHLNLSYSMFKKLVDQNFKERVGFEIVSKNHPGSTGRHRRQSAD